MLTEAEHLLHLLDIAAEGCQVAADKPVGVIDFVGHAGSQAAHRGQLLLLQHPGIGHLQFSGALLDFLFQGERQLTVVFLRLRQAPVGLDQLIVRIPDHRGVDFGGQHPFQIVGNDQLHGIPRQQRQ